MDDIARNLEKIRHKIDAAAAAADVVLIAVSKGQPEAAIRKALQAGHKIFGENRVQEAKTKYAGLRDEFPDLELHLIGPLQTNKAEEAVKLFDVIETLDRPNLAGALAKAIKKTGRAPRLYVEINIGSEPQKAGVLPEQLGPFLCFCRDDCGLKIEGLMCIPPQKDDPTLHFKRMRGLAMQHGLKHLSMGMSADFEIAISCGATEIRVGTAIFGARN